MKKILLYLLSFLLLSSARDGTVYTETLEELMSYKDTVEEDVKKGKETVLDLPDDIYFEADVKGEKVEYVLSKKAFFFYAKETEVTYSSSFYLAF
jgi:transcriptional regulator